MENAFIHGFVGEKKKKITLSASRRKDNIQMKIGNSGVRLTKQECAVINQGIAGNTSHGLSMIYQKLRAAFGADCVFTIGIEKNGDTAVKIQIPFQESERRMS